MNGQIEKKNFVEDVISYILIGLIVLLRDFVALFISVQVARMLGYFLSSHLAVNLIQRIWSLWPFCGSTVGFLNLFLLLFFLFFSEVKDFVTQLSLELEFCWIFPMFLIRIGGWPLGIFRPTIAFNCYVFMFLLEIQVKWNDYKWIWKE